MKARLLLNQRHQLRADAFVELRIWRAPQSVRGSVHRFKYALAYVVRGECVLRYDNEAGKGDHRHVGEVETAYRISRAGSAAGRFLARRRSMEAGMTSVTLSIASREGFRVAPPPRSAARSRARTSRLTRSTCFGTP